MTVGIKVASFLAALVAVFAVAASVGRVVGPIGGSVDNNYVDNNHVVDNTHVVDPSTHGVDKDAKP